MNKKWRLSIIATLFLIGGALPTYALELLGAGATFPYPFYAKINYEYNKKTQTKINYQSIGSGGGIQQLKNKTVDFGASDAFLSNAEAKTMPAEVIHIPTCLGAVAMSFNLPGVTALNLTAEVISEIFLGTITKWNDPKIQTINPKAKLPNMTITTVHRSDGSGTTSIFTSYLAYRSSAWKTKVGAGKSINWPNGVGGKGNTGVAGLIKQIPGSIGYIEQLYAKQNKMNVAAIKNDKGQYVMPTEGAVSDAAASIKIPADTRVSIVDTKVLSGYPISSFTWILVYKDLKGLPKEKAKELKNYLTWIIHDGQVYANELGYAPLPTKVIKTTEGLIKKITYKGSSL